MGRGISVYGASYFEFVVPGIIALTAMNSSFNGAGTRLNVDRLYFKSFDECLMAPISHLSLFLVSLLLTCLAFAFFGVLAALLARSHEDMATFGSLILLPMTFLGGTFFSVSQVPAALKFVLYALPLTHSSMCLRAAALDQAFPWGSFLAIGCFWLAFFIGCTQVLKRASV
ncbi:MAG: ABC transporter permease [Methanotrichaceae archaeon]